jgi:O-antigen/teichoic acid export membrane protein
MESASLPPEDDGGSEPPVRRGRRVALNAFARGSTDILVKLTSLLLFVVLARKLGSGPLGEFTFALAIQQVLWAVCGLGLDRMTVRDMARDRDAVHHLFYNALAIKCTAAVIGTLLAMGGLVAAGFGQRLVVLVGLMGIGLCIGFASASAQSIFQAHERMGWFFYAAVPAGLLNAGLGLAAIFLGFGVIGVVVGNIVAHLVGITISFSIVFRRFVRPRVTVDPRTWPGMVRGAIPFGVQEMFGQIIFRFDTVLLGLLATAVVVGEYGAAYRMLEATLFVAWAIGTAVLPMFSYLPVSGGDGGTLATLGDAYAFALRLVTGLMAPIATALFVCAESIVELLYGPEFEESVVLLRLLAAAILLYGIGHVSGLIVLVRRSARVSIAYNTGIALLSVVLALALIPPLQAQGAAISTLVAEGLLAVVGLVLASEAAGRPKLLPVFGPAALACAAMAAAMVPLEDRLWLALPAGGVVYLAALGAFEARRLGTDLAALRRARAAAAA